MEFSTSTKIKSKSVNNLNGNGYSYPHAKPDQAYVTGSEVSHITSQEEFMDFIKHNSRPLSDLAKNLLLRRGIDAV